jgi:hypothetical protein
METRSPSVLVRDRIVTLKFRSDVLTGRGDHS